MVNISSKSEARKRIRDAQNKAKEERAARERQNADDTATLVVALGRLKAVDEWQEKRVTEICAEADRRRHQHAKPPRKRWPACRAEAKHSPPSPHWPTSAPAN